MEVQSSPKRAKQGYPKRGKLCLRVAAVVLVLVVLLIAIIILLAFTAFKPKHPVSTIDSVRLEDLSMSMDVLRVRVNLNVSLGVDLSLNNPNKFGFKYSNSSALLNYRGQLVGEAPIPGSEISADETTPMNLTLTLMADRFLSDSELLSDVMGGALPFNTFVELSGKVVVWNLFRFHVVSSTSCDFTLFLSNRTVGNQNCKYKTKL